VRGMEEGSEEDCGAMIRGDPARPQPPLRPGSASLLRAAALENRI